MKQLPFKGHRLCRTASTIVAAFSILLVVGGSRFSVGSVSLMRPAFELKTPMGEADSKGSATTAGVTDYSYSISGKVNLTDYRIWCDPAKEPLAAQYRVKCTRGSTVALPTAQVFVVDASSNTRLASAVTGTDGSFSMKWTWTSTEEYKTRRVKIETNFTGFPRDPNYASFEVYSNADVQGPPDLKNVYLRTSARAYTPVVTCSPACNAGTLSLVTQTCDTLQNVAAVYLSLNYAYTDSLYVEGYHDYCKGLAKKGSSCPYDAKYAVINVSDGPTTTGNETGFIQLNNSQAQDSAILHELGHALEFWAGHLTPGTGGKATPTEAWANFVRLAYQYSQGAKVVKDYDPEGYDIESQEPLCDADNDPKTPLVPYSVGKDSAFCKPEDTTINWRFAFWDLYDTQQESNKFLCEPLSDSGNNGDHMIVSFATMLEAWRNSLQYGTANHGWAETKYGDDDKSTNNLRDYVYNLSVVAHVPLWQVEGTAIGHACQTAQPSD